MKRIIFLALIILTALLSVSCLNITYNYYGKDDTLSPYDAEVVAYETKDEATTNREVEETEVSVQETLPISEDSSDKPSENRDELMETSGETPAAALQVSHLSSPISQNQSATISVIGKPFTTYSISVYYSTTASSAKGLEPKISDENGNATWSWKIGGGVKTGSYLIVISDGSETIETIIQVN